MKACKIIRGGEQFRGSQGLNYFAGVSAESAGSEGICMHLLEMQPGAVAKAHYHEAHETAIFVLQGRIELAHGQDLEHVDLAEAGEFAYIPSGVPHRPCNPTGTGGQSPDRADRSERAGKCSPVADAARTSKVSSAKKMSKPV